MGNFFDVAVIGAGPGGYVAAIRCAQLGLSAVCIDERENTKGKASLGGTCLNVGCIPSKALLESSENFICAKSKFLSHGINIKGVSIDVPTMIARKDKIVKIFTSGITALFKKNKIASMHGKGTLLGKDENQKNWQVAVNSKGSVEIVQAKYIIIATGSSPRQLPLAPVDNIHILDNSGALALTHVPKRLGVIGAGVIGLEIGSVWNRLGSRVTILEAMPGFLAEVDEQIAKEARRVFQKNPGLSIQTGITIKSTDVNKNNVVVTFTDIDGTAQKLEVDRLIVAAGRVPNTNGLTAKQVDLTVDDRGAIAVDGYCQTNLPNIYAVGDVVRGPMLAHKASEEGAIVAEMIATIEKNGKREFEKINYSNIPWVIYTSPEIAWVGKTEQELKSAGVSYKVGQFPFAANGRARAMGESTGFIKVLADAYSDRILGIHMIGPHVSELISEAVLAMEFTASSEDIARTIHAHPSLSEALREAALSVDKRALHI